ncbi:MAG TPA: DUF58 domain-containing protein [Gemmatimonadaceae bacterium]
MKRLRFPFVAERRLALLVAAGGVLWLIPGVGNVLAELWLGALLLAVVADIALLPSRAGVSVDRAAPAAVGVGDSREGSYAVVSHWPRSLHVRMMDDIPPAVTGGVGHAAIHLAPFASRQIGVEFSGRNRGRVPLGPIGARVTTSLALVGAKFSWAPDDHLLVVPSVSGVRRFRLLAIKNRLETAGVREMRRKGDGQGFAGLRDYVLGDDPRHVDWKATARHHRAIVREFTIERSQVVLTLIDAGRGMTQMAGSLSRFEHALSSALVLTDVAATAGDRVGTLVFDDEIRSFVPPTRSKGALQAVRDALIPVTATTSEPDYAAAFRFLATHQRKRALVVFYTDVLDVRASKSLIAHAARSAMRHLAVVVALRNDAIFAAAQPRSTRLVMATAGAGEDSRAVPELYERAAAEEMIQAREEVLERMRRAGVIVLDVSPQHMTPSVVNRYLELKARGAL